MTMRMRATAIALGTALLLGGPARADIPGRPAAAAPSPQAPRSQPAKPLQYEVDVVLKLIQVHVTDKKGHPVRDLVREDFTVTDNGQPVAVTAFEKHALTPVGPGPSSNSKPDAAAAPAPASPRPPARKFFLLFDFAYNNVRGIEKARKAALHFIDSVAGPTDEVAVLSYAAIGGLAFHEYLTTDHAQVRKVLEGIGHKDVRGRATDIEDYYWRFVQASGGPFVTSLRAQAEANRQEAEDMAQKYMLTLTDLARALRLVDGEKNFILFSTGIPSSLIYGYATSSALNRSDVSRAAGHFELRRQNEDMDKEFGAAGCAFYAFDTRESAKGTSLFAYDEETFEQGSRAMTTINDPTTIFLDDKATGLNSLKRLTDTTGGTYYSNINMYERNLAQVQDATGAYYVLGFPINERWDGAFHEVKVEVTRKGCQVRTQAGYFDPKPFAEYSDVEKQIHLFDLAINERSFSRLPGAVPIAALSYAVAGGSRLAVVARLPREMTAKLSGPKVEIVALFFDDNGDIAEMIREEASVAPLRGRDMVLAAGAALRPGDYAGRLIVRDLATGRSAVASARGTVVRPAPAALQLGTPLVLAIGSGGLLVEPLAPKSAGHAPFGEGYPYDASRFAPVLGDVPAGAGRVAVVVPCSAPGGGEADLVLTASLVDAATGAQRPADATLAGRVLTGTLEVLMLDVPVAATPPGTYFLHVYAKDRRTGALGHAVATLTLSR